MKIIKIEKCGECKHAGVIYCNHPNGPKGDIYFNTIHPDCPLDDAGELAELRAKAEKWGKVKYHDEHDAGCNECYYLRESVCIMNDCPFEYVVDAIEGTKEADDAQSHG
jgi:hypothetical protein